MILNIISYNVVIYGNANNKVKHLYKHSNQIISPYFNLALNKDIKLLTKCRCR